MSLRTAQRSSHVTQTLSSVLFTFSLSLSLSLSLLHSVNPFSLSSSFFVSLVMRVSSCLLVLVLVVLLYVSGSAVQAIVEPVGPGSAICKWTTYDNQACAGTETFSQSGVATYQSCEGFVCNDADSNYFTWVPDTTTGGLCYGYSNCALSTSTGAESGVKVKTSSSL